MNEIKGITFNCEYINMDFLINEISKNPNNKLYNLSKENGWNKIGEYFDKKYFVNNIPSSTEYRQIIRELTDEEFNIYNCGDGIGGLVKIIGFGEAIYRNKNTKEEIRHVIQRS